MSRKRNNPNETQTKENKTMANVLDAAQISELLSKQKSRGDYGAQLTDFIKSNEAGIEVSLIEGVFAGKKASNLKTGFDLARKRTNDAGALVIEGGNSVKVISVKDDGGEDHVYLIRTDLVG